MVESVEAIRAAAMVAKGVWRTGSEGTLSFMSPDEELMVIFGALHLVALVLGLILFVMFLRSEAGSGFRPPDEDDGGGGGNDRVTDKPKNSPSGGIPLPDALQSSFRLRSHERLRDAYRHRERRRVSEPARPSRRRVTG
jgi:hypothetical protein